MGQKIDRSCRQIKESDRERRAGVTVAVFNRREVYTTFNMKKFNKIRTCLEQARIKYTYRTVSRNGSVGIAPDNRSRMGSVGVNLQKDLECLVYVKKSDYEKTFHVLK